MLFQADVEKTITLAFISLEGSEEKKICNWTNYQLKKRLHLLH